MAIEALASWTTEIRTNAPLRDRVAQGDIPETDFSPEEKEALMALARRLQEGSGLPKYLKRPLLALQWFGPPPEA